MLIFSCTPFPSCLVNTEQMLVGGFLPFLTAFYLVCMSDIQQFIEFQQKKKRLNLNKRWTLKLLYCTDLSEIQEKNIM